MKLACDWSDFRKLISDLSDFRKLFFDWSDFKKLISNWSDFRELISDWSMLTNSEHGLFVCPLLSTLNSCGEDCVTPGAVSIHIGGPNTET